MAAAPLETVVQHIVALTSAEVSDRELLTRYLHEEDNSAFAAIIRRHGRVVLGVCRRLLGPGPDADDAFQATFVVLARKASSIRKQSSLASWLHGVAQRISSQSRSKRARQRQLESTVAGLTEAGHARETDHMRADPASRASMREMGVILDEELQRLPPACRDALVLCLMENVSHTDAAKRLDCPLGTLKGRIQRGRDLLRQRLERRGIELTGIALSVLLAEQARAAVSASLLQATLHGAAHHATAPAVAALAEAVLATMTGKVKAMLAVIVLAGVTLAGVGVGAYVPSDEPAPVVMKVESPTLIQAKPEKKTELLDAFGDLLPEGAVSRLGTVRWRHGNWVLFAAFAPDGKSVISAQSDGLIRVWSFPSGQEIRRFGKLRDGAYISRDAVVMSKDGKVLATKFLGADIQCYDVETGKLLATIDSTLDKSSANVIALSPQGKHIAVKRSNGTLEVYDWAHSKEVLKVPPPEAGKRSLAQNWVSFSEDGKWLMDVCSDTKQKSSHYLRIMQAENAALVREIPLPESEGLIRPPILASDGKSIAVPVRMPSTKKDPQAKKEPRYDVSLIDLGTGKELSKVYTAMGPGAFSPDGTKFYSRDLAAPGGNTPVREFDVASGAELRKLGEYSARKQAGPKSILPQYLSISSQGEFLVIFGGVQSLQILDVKKGKEHSNHVGHSSPPLGLNFSADGRQLITQGPDLVPIRWDAANGKLLSVIDTHNISEFYSALVVSPDGTLISAQMYGLVKGSVGFFDVATGKELGVFPIPDQDLGSYGNTIFSPDGKLAAVRWKGARRIELRETPSAKLLRSLQIVTPEKEQRVGPDGRDLPGTMFFSPNSKKLVSYADPGALGIWDVTTGKRLGRLPLPEGERIQHGDLSPDGRCMALEMNNGVVKLFELETLQLRHALGGAAPTNAEGKIDQPPYNIVENYKPFAHQLGSRVGFSPDGQLVAHAGIDQAVHLWHAGTGRETAVLKGHFGPLSALAFSSDGRRLASASADTTALIWDVSRFTQPSKTVELTAADLDVCWKDLSSDAQTAFRAIGKLVDSPMGAVTLMKDRMKPAPRVDEQRITSLIADLGSDTFKTRDSAMKELEKMGELASEQLGKALTGKVKLEMKQRIEQLLGKLEGAKMPPETLRQIRAVEVLEFIATPAARELLQRLAAGAMGARLTREAQQTLVRLKMK